MLERTEEGTVRLFGEKSPRIHSRKANRILRTRFSYLFQNYALIDNATVNENLEVPLVYSKKTKQEKQELKRKTL